MPANHSGTDGNDVFVVDSADDTFVDPGGFDTVRTSLAAYNLPMFTAEIEGLEYTGTADFSGNGNNLNNVLMGGAGDDTLQGGMGLDTISGGSGNDVLVGGTLFPPPPLPGGPSTPLTDDMPGDVLEGGDGDDTYVVGIGDAVVEASGSGTDTVEFTRGSALPNANGPVGYILGDNIENLSIYDSSDIHAQGNDLNNVISVGMRNRCMGHRVRT